MKRLFLSLLLLLGYQVALANHKRRRQQKQFIPNFVSLENLRGCGGEYSSASGTIRYPLNGGNYTNHDNCTWIIRTAGPIKITFECFDTERTWDYLCIRDGVSIEDEVIGNFTGVIVPRLVQTSTNAARVHFTSDGSVASTGFELHWESSTIQCGIVNTKRTKRIIGGSTVNIPLKYPWQVGLHIPHTIMDMQFSCGGSIINNRWILTAAHCVVDNNTCSIQYNSSSLLKVWVGVHGQFYNDDAHVADTKEYRIKTYAKHPNYNCLTQDYDFALLELSEPIPFNDIIRPICLPKDNSKTYYNQDATVTGWGSTSNNGDSQNSLKELQVMIIDNTDCARWGSLPDNQICATGWKVWKSQASCGTDSGGPMTVVETNKYVQVGVVSYRHKSKCASFSYPGIYARVSKALPWIASYTHPYTL